MMGAAMSDRGWKRTAVWAVALIAAASVAGTTLAAPKGARTEAKPAFIPMPTEGWEIVIGGSAGAATALNSYDDFADYAGAGLGLGGSAAVRYRFQSNVFVGLEIAGMG